MQTKKTGHIQVSAHYDFVTEVSVPDLLFKIINISSIPNLKQLIQSR